MIVLPPKSMPEILKGELPKSKPGVALDLELHPYRWRREAPGLLRPVRTIPPQEHLDYLNTRPK
jgi:hypothetical protein